MKFKKIIQPLLGVWGGFCSFVTFAQIEPAAQVGTLRITWPINRATFQQNVDNQATIDIAGQFIGNLPYSSVLEYKIVKLNTQDGSEGVTIINAYETITSFNNTISSKYLKTFLFNELLNKGWYCLQVRLRKRISFFTITLARTEVLFGVGDNYLIAGQSNASGYFDRNDEGIKQNAENYIERHGVSVIDRKDLDNTDASIKIEGLPIHKIIKDINANTIGYEQKGFSKLEKTKNGTYSYIYPRGVGSWCWGPLASKLIENQTDTPLMFFNSAQRDSQIKQWSDKYWKDDSGNIIFNPYGGCTVLPCLRDDYWVYKQFRSALQMYGHICGVKAILWHQGEKDAQINTNVDYYTERMSNTIGQSRTDIGNPNLSWLSSQVSYYSYDIGGTRQVFNEHPESSPSSLNLAQQAVWNTDNKKYQGVFTDDLGANARNSVLKIHFTGETLKTVGERWYDKNPVQATPTEGKPLLNLSVQLVNSDTQYRLTPIVPSGVSVVKYFWVENENGIYNPINSNLNQNYIDVPATQAGLPKFITCYAGVSTGEDIGNATDGWNLKLYVTQPFIIPGYENAPAMLAPSKNLLAYNPNGGNNTFTLSATNLTWTATENSSWVSFQTSTEDVSGGEGNYPMTINTIPNTSTTARTAYITVQQEGGGITETIEIYQEGIDDCNTSLNLVSPQNDYLSTITKKTASTIQATNKLMTNGTTITYKAGNSITLNAGFKVENGVVFNAQIEGCIADTPWMSSVVGSISGTTNINNGTLTIDGTGTVSGIADNFQFYNKAFSGDVTVIARIVNITAIDGMRGGIMLRSNTNQNAKMYEFILDGNANTGKLKRRNTGENADFIGYAPMPTSNTWLKMTKTNYTILCYVSSDGSTWNELVGWDDHADNDLGSSFLVGFVAYNSGNSQYCTAIFDNMIVNGVPVN